jgi:hypothetical protein
MREGLSLVEGEPLIVVVPPTWARYYIVGFGFVWFAIVAVFLVGAAANGQWAAILVALALAAYGWFVMWRTFHLGLRAYGDEIVVSNMFKTRRIPRLSVDGFRIGSPSTPMSFGRTIVFSYRTTRPSQPMGASGPGLGSAATHSWSVSSRNSAIGEERPSAELRGV